MQKDSLESRVMPIGLDYVTFGCIEIRIVAGGTNGYSADQATVDRSVESVPRCGGGPVRIAGESLAGFRGLWGRRARLQRRGNTQREQQKGDG